MSKIINRSIFIKAIIDVLPLSIAVIPWGVLTGAIAIQIGLTVWQSQAMSLLVFAGAAQLSSMTLMANAASPLSIFGTTFVISSRHLLYSITFRQHVTDLSFAQRCLTAFVLTDEMFAVSETHTRTEGQFSANHALISGFAFYIIWNMATLLGILAGDFLGDLDALGLNFAIAATFIAMTFDKIRQWSIAMCMLSSGVFAVLLQPYFPGAYIVIAGVIGMSVGYFLSTDEKHDQKIEFEESHGYNEKVNEKNSIHTIKKDSEGEQQ